MPVVLLERLPLPSLKTYTSISVLLLGCAVYYAHQVVTDVETALSSGTAEDENSSNLENQHPIDPNRPLGNLTGNGYVLGMISTLAQEAWCVWTLINMAYCCLILVGKLIQKMVFGNLRVSEQQHIKDKFWNFMFYKFIFIFGVMNVQNMDEVLLWCAWFSVLGFQHLMVQLCKDRFEYLSFSANTPKWTHAKVLFLLFSILTLCFCLTLVAFIVGFDAGLNVFGFMIAECVLLMAKTMHVVLRYGIHLVDLNKDGVWENRVAYVYYSELVFELLGLSVDFVHHLHMLLYGNIFLSMASLVICMQLRYLFHEFQRRIKRHKNYLRVVNSMEARFPMATQKDIDDNSDSCAICWDKMESARKLPCGHLFHNTCLTSWLEQDTSCPTCRMSLSERPERPREQPPIVNPPGPTGDLPASPPPQNLLNRTTNHFFHFDGSRYVSWLPSFSVEVTHTQIMGHNGPQGLQIQTSQFDNMARQVQAVFPDMPINTITEDLRITRSVEVTIENILEGRLVAPPAVFPNRTTLSSSAEEDTVVQQEASLPDNGASSSGSLLQQDFSMSHQEYSVMQTTDASSTEFSSDDSPSEESSSTPAASTSAFGSRFSKSPDERESMLESRKEELFNAARRRFLSNGDGQSAEDSDVNFSSQDLQRRRELLYRATQRRLNGSDNYS